MNDKFKEDFKKVQDEMAGKMKNFLASQMGGLMGPKRSKTQAVDQSKKSSLKSPTRDSKPAKSKTTLFGNNTARKGDKGNDTTRSVIKSIQSPKGLNQKTTNPSSPSTGLPPNVVKINVDTLKNQENQQPSVRTNNNFLPNRSKNVTP